MAGNRSSQAQQHCRLIRKGSDTIRQHIAEIDDLLHRVQLRLSTVKHKHGSLINFEQIVVATRLQIRRRNVHSIHDFALEAKDELMEVGLQDDYVGRLASGVICLLQALVSATSDQFNNPTQHIHEALNFIGDRSLGDS